MNTTAVIPFYNEGQRIFKVLETLQSVEQIKKIICVDDGSTESVDSKKFQAYKNVLLLQLNRNSGKTAAIATAIKYVDTEYILLLDADLIHLNATEIENALKAVNDSIDMIVLRRTNDTVIGRMFGSDVVLSGERIIKKIDLEKVLQENLKGYQLEVAINKYMMDNKKVVYWMPHSAVNYHRVYKYGLVKGVIKEIEMGISIISYIGVGGFLKQLLFFCKKNPNN